MTYSSEVLADAPVAYYRMGEAGLPLANSGSLGSAANVSSGPWGSGTNPVYGQPSLISEAGDGAVSFAGKYVQTPNNALPAMTSLTIEFWVKTTNNVAQTLLSRNPASGTKLWKVWTNGGTLIYTDLYWNKGFVGGVVGDGKSHHVAITQVGTAINIYVDGVLTGSGTDTSTLPGATPPLFLGNDDGGSSGTGLLGTLDEVAIYDKGLSAARIAAHYNAGKPPAPALTVNGVAFTGSGSFAANVAGPARTVDGIAFTGSGALAIVDVDFHLAPEMVMQILDTDLPQAPTPVTVVIAEGVPETLVTFDVDGTVVGTAYTDSDGYLAPTSINVPESVGAAGVHTLTATQVGTAGPASATFSLRRSPTMAPIILGPDAQAVDVPGAVRANGTRRWVFQDLLPGGLGSWIMPKNPAEGPMPYLERQYTTKTTTTGRAHVSEGGVVPVEWQFSGIALDEAFAEQLLAYGNLNRRFYIIDHRAQAFKVIVTNVDLVPRMRKIFGDDDAYLGGREIDGHDYTVTATVLDQDWVVPA